MNRDWQPIASAPFQTVFEARNAAMGDDTIFVTRGYETGSGVHPDDTFCTSVFTPDKSGIHCLGFPAGRLVIPTEWRAIPCVNHPDVEAITELDGDRLCKPCADAWVRAEGDAA